MTRQEYKAADSNYRRRRRDERLGLIPAAERPVRRVSLSKAWGLGQLAWSRRNGRLPPSIEGERKFLRTLQPPDLP